MRTKRMEDDKRLRRKEVSESCPSCIRMNGERWVVKEGSSEVVR